MKVACLPVLQAGTKSNTSAGQQDHGVDCTSSTRALRGPPLQGMGVLLLRLGPYFAYPQATDKFTCALSSIFRRASQAHCRP